MSRKNKVLLFNVLKNFLDDNYIQTLIVSQEETEQVIISWNKKFILNSLNKNESLWHTFSFNHFPNESGKNAVKRFNETPLNKFIIFSNADFFAIDCTASSTCFLKYEELYQQLNLMPIHIDLFITHVNFKWTFVITHEKDFGPYYASSKITAH